jgi:hypothetical protein
VSARLPARVAGGIPRVQGRRDRSIKHLRRRSPKSGPAASTRRTIGLAIPIDDAGVSRQTNTDRFFLSKHEVAIAVTVMLYDKLSANQPGKSAVVAPSAGARCGIYVLDIFVPGPDGPRGVPLASRRVFHFTVPHLVGVNST